MLLGQQRDWLACCIQLAHALLPWRGCIAIVILAACEDAGHDIYSCARTAIASHV